MCFSPYANGIGSSLLYAPTQALQKPLSLTKLLKKISLRIALGLVILFRMRCRCKTFLINPNSIGNICVYCNHAETYHVFDMFSKLLGVGNQL